MLKVVAVVQQHRMEAAAATFAIVGAVALFVRHSLEGSSEPDTLQHRLIKRALLAGGFAFEASAIALEASVRIFGAQ